MTDQVPTGETSEAEVQVMDAPVTEEPFDKERAMETIKKLRESEKQAKKERAELERLRQLEDDRKKAELSETDRLKAELQELDAKLKEKTKESERLKIASKIVLPTIFALRIQGETPEEMEADAKQMLDALPKQKAAPNTGPTNPGDNATLGETEDQKRKRLFG